MATIDEQCKHIKNVLTKKGAKNDGEQTGREIAAKLDARYPGNKYDDARTFGRAISSLVNDGVLIKSGSASRPKYTRA